MGHVLKGEGTMDQQAQELLDTARLLHDNTNKTGFEFINSELDMSRAFAKRAWSLCSTGHLAEAKVQGMAAITAYETAKSFSPSSAFPSKNEKSSTSKSAS